MLAILHHTKRPEHLPTVLNSLPSGRLFGSQWLIANEHKSVDGFHCYVSNEGQTWALWETFRRFLWYTKEPHLTVLEDDILPCKNAWIYIHKLMERVLDGFDSFDWVSWFNNEEKVYERIGRWQFRRARHKTSDDFAIRFHGNSAMTLPRRTVEKLLGYPVGVYIDQFKRANAGDLAMTEAMPDALVAYHRPSLVKHIGLVSTWYPKERPALGFETPTYLGPDFDALSML